MSSSLPSRASKGLLCGSPWQAVLALCMLLFIIISLWSWVSVFLQLAESTKLISQGPRNLCFPFDFLRLVVSGALHPALGMVTLGYRGQIYSSLRFSGYRIPAMSVRHDLAAGVLVRDKASWHARVDGGNFMRPHLKRQSHRQSVAAERGDSVLAPRKGFLSQAALSTST